MAVNEDDYLDYYCPECGKQSPVLSYCSGRGEAPHPPRLTVSTDEIKGQPNREESPEQWNEWAKKHTKARGS